LDRECNQESTAVAHYPQRGSRNYGFDTRAQASVTPNATAGPSTSIDRSSSSSRIVVAMYTLVEFLVRRDARRIATGEQQYGVVLGDTSPSWAAPASAYIE
jgi:hypothetical protein